MGDELAVELATLLEKQGLGVKTAAKKEEKDEKKEEKKEEKEPKKEEKDEKKEEKKDKKKDEKKKKGALMLEVVNSLAKLATELDEAGAEEASSLVDDALRVIVRNLEVEADADKKSE